jgi:hypothetical protein
MAYRFNGANQLEFRMFLDKTDQRLAHTSGCAAHNNICWHACFPFSFLLQISLFSLNSQRL